MGPAEIVASLKELCAEKGPRLTTEEIVAWIDGSGGFETRRRPDRVRQEDEGPAVCPDARVRGRGLRPADQAALELPRPVERREVLCRHPGDARERAETTDPAVCPVLKQLRGVRKAMADYFAGQRFFDFYTGLPEDDEVEEKTPRRGTRRLDRGDVTSGGMLEETLRGIATRCRAS